MFRKRFIIVTLDSSWCVHFTQIIFNSQEITLRWVLKGGSQTKNPRMESKGTYAQGNDSMSTNDCYESGMTLRACTYISCHGWGWIMGLLFISWINLRILKQKKKRERESNNFQMVTRVGVPTALKGGWGVVTWETPCGGRRAHWSHLSLDSGWNRSTSLTSRHADSPMELSANSFPLSHPHPYNPTHAQTPNHRVSSQPLG